MGGEGRVGLGYWRGGILDQNGTCQELVETSAEPEDPSDTRG